MMEGVILCYSDNTLLLIRVRVWLNLLKVYFFNFCLFVCCISIPGALCWAPSLWWLFLKVGCWLLVVVCCCLLFCCVNLFVKSIILYFGGREVHITVVFCPFFSFSFFFFSFSFSFFFLVELFLGCCVLSVSVLNHCFLLGTTATFFPLTPLFSYFYISIPCISYSSSC